MVEWVCPICEELRFGPYYVIDDVQGCIKCVAELSGE